jgi:hypothetical protein
VISLRLRNDTEKVRIAMALDDTSKRTRDRTDRSPRRCINWWRLSPDVTPKYCGRPFCPLHGGAERNRRRIQLLKQLPQSLSFFSWIVHIDCRLLLGCEAKEVGLVFDAVRRGIRRELRGADVRAITHWHERRVHLHILIFANDNTTPTKKGCMRAVREALCRRGRNACPERRAVLAKGLRFKHIWPATVQSAEVALNYATKARHDLDVADLPPFAVKNVPFCYGFKKIPDFRPAKSRVNVRVKSCNDGLGIETTNQASDDGQTANAAATSIAPSESE